MTDRVTALRVLASLRGTPVGDGAVLVGSSGLFGFSTGVPALTEDVDVAISEDVVAQHGDEIVRRLQAEGYRHEAGTATFTDPGGLTFDLLGYGDPGAGDHIAGAAALRVMVFADLSLVIGKLDATGSLAEGGRSLSPAGFVATKLLTERGAKGAKDKLQAVLVIAERETDSGFTEELRNLMCAVDRARRDDARASSLEAFLALGKDPAFADSGAEAYHPWLRLAERGLALLGRVLDSIDG